MIVRTSSWPKHKHFVTLKPNRGLWSTFTQQLPKTNFHLMYHPKIDLVFFLLLEISDSVVAQRYIIHRVSQIVVVKPYSQIYTEKGPWLDYIMGVPWISYNNLSDKAITMRFLFLNIMYCNLMWSTWLVKLFLISHYLELGICSDVQLFFDFLLFIFRLRQVCNYSQRFFLWIQVIEQSLIIIMWIHIARFKFI